MGECLSLEVSILMLLMNFIENKNGKENKDEAAPLAAALALLPSLP